MQYNLIYSPEIIKELAWWDFSSIDKYWMSYIHTYVPGFSRVSVKHFPNIFLNGHEIKLSILEKYKFNFFILSSKFIYPSRNRAFCQKRKEKQKIFWDIAIFKWEGAKSTRVSCIIIYI